MNIVIIVSVCLRVIKMKKNDTQFEFHFRGVYAGFALKKVILTGAVGLEIQKNKEYLIKVQVTSINEGVLSGEILRIKPLDEYWDRS